MDDSRFFTMTQFWQSLGVAVVVGGLCIAGATYALPAIEKHQENAKAATASSTPADTNLAAAVATATAPTDPFAAMKISGRAAIVVDLSNGHTLYTQNADAQLPLASLTKLLTMYAAQRVLSPGSIVTISSTSLAQDGEYGLAEGETFAYKDIARFAMVASSNDAAEAVAEAAASANGQTIAQYMAGAVSSAGLSHTIATNGTGLDVDTSEAGAYGSARDIAKLAGEFLVAAPDIAKATTRSSVTAYSTSGIAHSLPNTNPDVAALPGLLLSKTGYTDLAGGNLAVVFDAGINHQVAVVVLGSTHDARFTDVETLMRATRKYFAQQSNQ